jgi:hypothetical protein
MKKNLNSGQTFMQQKTRISRRKNHQSFQSLLKVSTTKTKEKKHQRQKKG